MGSVLESDSIYGLRDEDPGGDFDFMCLDTLDDPIFIRLYLASIANNGGNAEVSEDRYLELIRELNKQFSPYNMFFQRAGGPEYIRSTTLHQHNNYETVWSQLLSNFNKLDGIIMYSFANGGLPGINISGVASGIGDRYLLIKDNFGDLGHDKIAFHELGHALGLYHTFRASAISIPHGNITSSQIGLFDMFPDHPNCGVLGDFVCETTPDPGWNLLLSYGVEDYDESTCEVLDDRFEESKDDFELLRTLKDLFGTTIPWDHGISGNYYLNTDHDIGNHMSYNFHHCRHHFQPQQFERMRCVTKISNPMSSALMETEPTEISTTMSYASETRAETWIIIKSGGKLTISADLYMPYWGAIIVEPGGELVLDGGHIMPYADGDFWQGIEVLGTGTNTGNGKFTGTSGTIERARVAVHAENGGRVNLDGVIFLNNKGGVSIKDSRHLALPSYINNCTFTTDGVLHDLAWHVPLWDGGTLELEGEQNEYHDHTFFVRLENVNKMGMISNDFVTVQAPTSDHNGIGIVLIDSDLSISGGNFFKNQKVGIAKLNWQNGAHGITAISGNTFEDNFISIGLAKGDLSNIIGNEFVVPDIELGGQKAVGIYMQNSSGVSIKDLNIFAVSGVDDAEVPEESVFIYASNTGNVRSSDIQRNDFGSRGAPWRHIELHGAHPKLQISCNPFVQSAGTEFALGLKSGASLAHQGSTLNPAGNNWYHPTTCTGAVELYKDSGVPGYTYHSFNDDAPTCFSHGISIDQGTSNKQSTYCDMRDPCPGPMIDCVLAEVDIIRDDKEDITNNPPWYMSLDQISKVVDHLDWKRDLVVQGGIHHYMEIDSIEMLITLLDSIIVRDTSWTSVQALIADRYEEAPMRPGTGWTGVHSGSKAIQLQYKTASRETFQYTPLIMESEQDNLDFEMQTLAQQDLVNLFPNPANNEVQIPKEWSLSMARSTLHAKILDLSGRVAHQATLQNIGESINLDVSNLINGIYILHLTDSSGFSHNGKFIIKR